MKKIIKNIPNWDIFSAKSAEKIQLNQFPWYLFIGPRGAGKSSLLANSNINFILKNHVDQKTLDAIAAAGNCDWWVTADNVILDVPGSYLNSATFASPLSWQQLFAKKSGRENCVRGVIVALPLSDLSEREMREQLVINLKQRIAELQERFGRHLAFYFVVTKCDLLPGFLEFFNNSGSDELSQAWGISIPPLAENESIVDIFIQRFNALIHRLNTQLIWRLHQEMGSFERVFIKDFPLQVERLKEILVDVLKILPETQDAFCLQGVYLTSAMQQPSAEPPQTHLTTNASQQALHIMQTPVMPSRSYFIRQFLLQGLLAKPVQITKNWRQRSAVYALCASVVIVTMAFLGYDIFYGKNNYKSIEVSSFNVVVPPEKPQETKIGDSLTIVS